MRILVFGLAVLTVAAQVVAQTPPKINERAVSQLLAVGLKDPESLKIRYVKLHRSDEAGVWHLCGQYNAKNSYGGYAGFEYFVGSAMQTGKSPATYLIRDTGDFARSFCESLLAE